MDILLAIDWTVSPELFNIGPISIRWYGLLFATAFLLGHNILGKIFKNESINERWLDSVLIHVMIGTIVGARLGHVFFYGPYHTPNGTGYFDDPLSILRIWEGGLASHGAAIGIILALWVFSSKVSKRSILWILDRVVITVALAGFFIRFGNLMNHEIVGIPTDLPWAFSFAEGPQPVVPRHPAQLYESLSYLAIFVILFRAYWKQNAGDRQGFIFGLFLVLVFGLRFAVEFIKVEQTHLTESLPLRMGQVLSIPLVLAGLFFMFRSRKVSEK